MLQHVQQFLSQHRICRGRILVGLSGGADSVALLCGLSALANQFQIDVRVAHLDHGLRENSAEDAAWVSDLCEKMGVPLVIERLEASNFKGTAGVEESARKLRYRFFQQQARVNECAWVAVAHTADDQVETVLHHLVRGTGLKGLGGMPAVRPLVGSLGGEDNFGGKTLCLIRPLLAVYRSELLEYLESIQQGYRFDPSNTDPSYTRNRIRHELLPLIRNRFNPRVDDALQRLSTHAVETQKWIEEMAEALLNQCVVEFSLGTVKLKRQLGQQVSGVVLREMFRMVWERQSWPRKGLGYPHLAQLSVMFLSGTPRRAAMPGGVDVLCRRQVLELRKG